MPFPFKLIEWYFGSDRFKICHSQIKWPFLVCKNWFHIYRTSASKNRRLNWNTFVWHIFCYLLSWIHVTFLLIHRIVSFRSVFVFKKNFFSIWKSWFEYEIIWSYQKKTSLTFILICFIHSISLQRKWNIISILSHSYSHARKSKRKSR